MTELAEAAFLAATGDAGPTAPRGERFRAFARRFDERSFLAQLGARSLRWLARVM